MSDVSSGMNAPDAQGSEWEKGAAANGLACCHHCGRLAPDALQRCPRCRARLHLRRTNSLPQTMALVVTAAILYIPANVLPIMTTSNLGRSSENTILGGVVLLWNMGSYPVAAIIFIASVLVPIGKLAALTLLCIAVKRPYTSKRDATRLYRLTEFIGKWSMVDVFVVAILVGLIQVGAIMNITPGPAGLAFAGVVIVTMIAAEGFDQRLIWDHRDE